MKPYLSKEIRAQYLKMTRPKVNFRIPDLQAYYKVRTDLTHYRFDSQVMEDLIRLNLRYLDEDRRLNRYRLFQQTASFIWEYKPSAAGPFARSIRIFQESPNPTIIQGCFELFQRVSTDKFDLLFRTQSKSPFWDLIEILLRVPLSDIQWEWILNHAAANPHVRILVEQTSHKNKNVANWIQQNWNQEFASVQRARYAAHLIDWDPNFELSEETLIQDCDVLNAMDQAYIDAKIQEYNEEEIMREVENNLNIYPRWDSDWDDEEAPLGKAFSKDDVPDDDNDPARNRWVRMGMDAEEEGKEESKGHKDFLGGISYSERFGRQEASKFTGFERPYCFLPHTKRLYFIPQKEEKTGHVSFPDFEKGRELLLENGEQYRCKYNLWAIAESRLTKAEKFKRMKPFYREDLIYTWIHIAKLKQIPAMLKWVLNYEL
jgi:hypothetical protein